MSAPMRPWEATTLNNNGIIRNVTPTNPAIPQIGSTNTTRPSLPPKPLQNSYGVSNYNSYSPYSGYGGYSGSYGGMPYRSSLFSTPYGGYGSYGSYGGYNTYGGLGNYSAFGMRDNAEERKLRSMFGLKVTESAKSLAWNEAMSGAAAEAAGNSGGASWSTLAFLGVIISAPYIISKFLPKYEDKHNPQNWLSSGVRAKAAFDFVATSPNELTINTNDEIVLAPKQIQEEMRLYNTGWAFATCNGRSGVIPLNYIVVVKNVNKSNRQNLSDLPIPPPAAQKSKRVSFGENQIFELKNSIEENIPTETEKVADVQIPVENKDALNVNDGTQESKT
ncbi:peroxisomal membrane protein pex13 [Holotrichia oblita]|uniref:Peroxisomal membrane protein pex13 n=1 Tax=Holotrichia oblita TaxID=644536 RepID=A0ACB9TLC4_HOLOL|nr:peroxisomal membrane protein pex13 [Holotrichia oblita]